MRINEAAAETGMTPKNIRFYESEGLISPGRENANRYRTYSEADIERLRRIKLLRMLDVPLAECRAVLEGRQTLRDTMRRHTVTLEARRQALDSTLALCAALQKEESLDGVDIGALQAQMEAEQRKGVQFVDIEKRDVLRRRRVGAVIGAGLFAALMVLVFAMLLWAQSVDPLPWWLWALMAAIPAACVLGVLVVLYERLKEIRKDEIDAYRDY